MLSDTFRCYPTPFELTGNSAALAAQFFGTGLSVEDGPAILDTDSSARIVIHVHHLFLSIEPIRYVVTGSLLPAVLRRLAHTFIYLIDIAFLHTFLNLIPCITTDNDATYSGYLLAVTTADLTSDKATDYGTRYCSCNLTGILGWALNRNCLITTFLSRHGHRLGYRRDRHYFCVARRIQHSVAGRRANCGDRYGANDAADHELFAYHCLHP